MNSTALLSMLVGLMLIAPTTFAADVVINGVTLDEQMKTQLERGYGVPIKAGKYWYDNVSGVWGLEGGPAAGQIHPGLGLGGPLQRDASKGKSGVIVNGRKLMNGTWRRCSAAWQSCPGVTGSWPTGSAAPRAVPRSSTLPSCAAEDRPAVRA